MDKKYGKFLASFFCCSLAALVTANALTPDRDSSEVENRVLAQKPQLTLNGVLSGEYMADYETYVVDQFAGRDGWVAAKALSEKLIGKQENNGVYFCDDDTLITRFDAPKEDIVQANFGYVQKFADKVSVPVKLGLIPTQASVWSDRLPAGAPNYDQTQILSAAVAAGLDTIDVNSALTAHKDEAIFYRTDHHWTSLGAYYGYTALAGGLGFEATPLDRYEKTTVSTEFYGTVFSSSGVRWVKPDEMDTYVPETGITVTSYSYDTKGQLQTEDRPLYDKSYLTKKDKYAMFLGGQQALAVVKTGNTDKPKLLLVRDSYSDSLVPFLTANFSEIHLIDLRYYKQSTAQYVSDNAIDQVCILYSVPNFTQSKLVWLTK